MLILSVDNMRNFNIANTTEPLLIENHYYYSISVGLWGVSCYVVATFGIHCEFVSLFLSLLICLYRAFVYNLFYALIWFSSILIWIEVMNREIMKHYHDNIAWCILFTSVQVVKLNFILTCKIFLFSFL